MRIPKDTTNSAAATTTAFQRSARPRKAPRRVHERDSQRPGQRSEQAERGLTRSRPTPAARERVSDSPFERRLRRSDAPALAEVQAEPARSPATDAAAAGLSHATIEPLPIVTRAEPDVPPTLTTNAASASAGLHRRSRSTLATPLRHHGETQLTVGATLTARFDNGAQHAALALGANVTASAGAALSTRLQAAGWTSHVVRPSATATADWQRVTRNDEPSA